MTGKFKINLYLTQWLFELMGYAERKNIIDRIEKLRNSKLITYVVTTRPKIRTMMEAKDLREFYDHLDNDLNKKYDKVDLFIYSFGGETVLGWALVNLIREFTDNFCTLVPYNAFSCATSVALGANEVVMCKTGTLGPIDPQVSNEFNPEKQGLPIPISVEDIAGFTSLLKDKFEMKNEAYLAKLAERLATDIRPLALGNAYRQYIKAREDARKLLELHMDSIHDKAKIDKIIETLVEKLYFHGHHINRKEAKKIGLKISFAETVEGNGDTVDKLVWQLYLDYELELKMKIPYKDELPQNGQSCLEIPIKYIESSKSSSVYILEQEWVDMGFPPGSKISTANNAPAVYVPPNQIIPIRFQGQPVFIGNKIYEKREDSFWKSNE